MHFDFVDCSNNAGFGSALSASSGLHVPNAGVDTENALVLWLQVGQV